MQSDLDRRIDCFAALGSIFRDTAGYLAKQSAPADDRSYMLYKSAMEACHENPWFTPLETGRALAALGLMLEPSRLSKWLKDYPALHQQRKHKTIGLVMAGNIPLVGFHDMLCVLLSGHRLHARCSSQDTCLPVAVHKLLCGMDAWFENNMFFTEKIEDTHAVIATGSDNTARYFSWHYGHVPHIIRKNRNSVAILSGNESQKETTALGEDVFAYYGRGCRNVTHLLLPAGYISNALSSSWKAFRYVRENVSYNNNVRYQRAYLTAGGSPYHDRGFFIMREDPSVAPPVGVIHFTYYNNQGAVREFLKHHEGSIQCVVGSDPLKIIKKDMVSFGHTQRPGLSDYADNVDTLEFLLNLP